MAFLLSLLFFLAFALPFFLAVFIPLEVCKRYGLPALGLAYLVVLAVLVAIDTRYNWERVSYPNWWTAGLIQPWITVPVLLAGTVYALRSLLKSSEPHDGNPR